MKIAMPVKKKGETYLLSSAYGKAPFFLIYNLENNNFEIAKNEGLNGKYVADMLSSKNVKVVITNHIGAGAFNALQQKGIKAYFTEKKNTDFKEVIDEFKNGKLKEITPEIFHMIPKHHH